jgi:hypothetical protein
MLGGNFEHSTCPVEAAGQRLSIGNQTFRSQQTRAASNCRDKKDNADHKASVDLVTSAAGLLPSRVHTR